MFEKKRDISKVAQNILKKRYYSPGESKWEDIVNRVVDFVLPDASEERKETTRKMLEGTYFLPNSPCLVNAGKKNPGLLACFVVDFPDTIEGIYKTKLDVALIARKGGGCGFSLSKIRPEGSHVAGSTHGYAGGPLKFADTISHDADALTQSGFRSMALMMLQSVYHPDIVKFITAKTEEGKIANANMSVTVDDKFMEAVIADKTYWTRFKGKKYEEYRARDIFEMIIEGMWRNGEPGVLFYDRINDSPYKYCGEELIATNPSLRGSTRVITDVGVFPIKELEGKEFLVPNLDGRLSPAKCFLSGESEPIYEVELSGGIKYYATKEHRWPVLVASDETFVTKKKTEELKQGDKLPLSLNEKPHYGELGTYGEGFLSAWFGFDEKPLVRERPFSFSKSQINAGVFRFICEQLQELGVDVDKLPSTNQDSGTTISLDFTKDILGKFNETFLSKNENLLPEIVWNDASKQFIYGYFNGIISKMGEITNTGKVNIPVFNEGLGYDLLDLLGVMGIPANISTDMLRREVVEFEIRFIDNKILLIDETKRFYVAQVPLLNKEKDYIRKVVGIKRLKEREPVWDISVYDETHCFTLPNIITGNCAEQPLPSNGSCNLGSLDLSKFLDENNDFDWEMFEVAVRYGLRFLDDVIDKNSYPTKEIEEWAMDHRPVGLGVMGYADLLLMKEMAYGSKEAIDFLEEILSFMYKAAVDESEKLGEEKGVPKACQMLPEPRRNITITTVAPTGSVSLIAGCSGGIEPIFSEITVRNDKTGTYTFENELSEKPYFRCAVSSDGKQEVTIEEHIDVLAATQRHIDSGVSKTVNAPNNAKREDIARAVVRAWASGCKGVAVYRNGSRKHEVLSPKNVQKEKCPVCGRDMVEINGKRRCIFCTKEDLISNTSTYYD